MLDRKFLNIAPFKGMGLEELQNFATLRGITLEQTDIEEMRWELAAKDAERFANKGVRLEQAKNPIDILAIELARLSDRVATLEAEVKELKK